jgi:hypothetical protein
MARKAPAAPAQKPSGGAVELKRLSIDIPEELHLRIRVDALKRRSTMTEVVVEVLERAWPEGA